MDEFSYTGSPTIRIRNLTGRILNSSTFARSLSTITHVQVNFSSNTKSVTLNKATIRVRISFTTRHVGHLLSNLYTFITKAINTKHNRQADNLRGHRTRHQVKSTSTLHTKTAVNNINRDLRHTIKPNCNGQQRHTKRRHHQRAVR